MKYTIKHKRGKYYKKFKPAGLDLVAGVLIALAIIYILIEVIRGL
jgi:hypothetical protein